MMFLFSPHPYATSDRLYVDIPPRSHLSSERCHGVLCTRFIPLNLIDTSSSRI